MLCFNYFCIKKTDTASSGTTFMDELKNYLNKSGKQSDLHLFDKLINDLFNEEFDTESVKMDINLECDLNNKYDGNINIENYGETLCGLVKSFVKAQNS